MILRMTSIQQPTFPQNHNCLEVDLGVPLCSCKSFIILKASAIYSAHPGEGVHKLHVTTWQMSAMETFLGEPNTTE